MRPGPGRGDPRGVSSRGQTLHLPLAGAEAMALLEAQRRRVLERLARFERAEWSAPTRCHLWDVADVVAHLGDTNRWFLQAFAAREDPGVASPFAGFDGRATPHEQVVRSRGRSTGELCEDLASGTDLVIERLHSVRDAPAWLPTPFGEFHPHLLARHMLWDSWLHERDIWGTEAVDDTPAERAAVGAYGIFLAAVVLLAGEGRASFDVVLHGVSDLHLRVEVDDAVVVSDRGDGRSPDPDVSLEGPLSPVVDALAGRGPLADALSAPAPLLEALHRLARRMGPVPGGRLRGPPGVGRPGRDRGEAMAAGPVGHPA